MKKTNSRENGFTLIELIVAILVLAVLATFFVIQRNSLEASQRDAQRKTAINAMYYDLKDVYFAKNKNYPQTISRENLKEMDPELFTDPSGFILNGDKCSTKNGDEIDASLCNYHYSATNCDGEGKCESFKLTADMETEAEYSKSSD